MSKQTISGIVVSLTILALFVPASLQAAEKGDAILETIPADDAIFCVRVNNLNQTTAVLDQYLTGVSPMPVSTAGLVKGPLSMMFGNPELKGFDVNGFFAAFLTAESSQTPPNIYFLLPVTNYKLLLDPNFNVSQPDANGISTVGRGPAGQFLIKQVRSFALMTDKYTNLVATANLISNAKTTSLAMSLDAAQIKQASTEPIWCYANMVKVSAIYGSFVSEGIDGIKKQATNPGAAVQESIDKLEQRKKQIADKDPNSPLIAQLNNQIEELKVKKQQLQAQKTPEMAAKMIDVYAVVLKDFMQQAKSATLAFSPKPAVLNIKLKVNSLPGTEMAGILTAETLPGSKNPLIGYTEDGAAMNLVQRIDHPLIKKINSKFIDLVIPTTGKDPNDPNIVKTKKMCADMADSIGNFLVCSFFVDPNARPPFNAKYAVEIKDANLFNRTIDGFTQTWASSAFGDLYKKMGMDVNFVIKRGVEKYKDVSIDAATLSIKFTDMNAPETQMLNSMYGSGFNYRWAIVNGLGLYTLSGDANDLYKLIDKAKAGAPLQSCPEVKNAMALIPDSDKADIFATYNQLRMMKFMTGFTPMPFKMPDVPTKSNLAFAVKVENGSASVEIAAPKDHIIEISKAFQMMAAQMMQQQMQQSPQGMPK